jgi:Flp pilus assembly protein TadD
LTVERTGAVGSALFGQISLSATSAAVAAALIAVLVYLNSLGNGFALDDRQVVLTNQAIQSFETLPRALASPYWPGELGRAQGLWRPATTAVMGATWIFSGGSPLPFHLLNVVLHAAVTATVVLLLARLTTIGVAAVSGILFAVHPVHVEAVANVIGLGELLSALPFLVACLVWIDGTPSSRAAEDGVRSKHRPPFAVPGPGRLALVAVLYAIAFLAKESAVVLPGILFVLDAIRGRIHLRDLSAYARPRLGAFAILGITALAVLAGRYNVLWGLSSPLPPPGAGLLAEIPRIFTVAGVWPEYFRLLLFPVSLSSDYAPPLIPIVTVWTPRGLLGVALVLATLAFALWCCRRARVNPAWSIVPFGVAWFCVTISTVSNVLFLSGTVLAERTLYLPSVGFAAAAAWALCSLPEGNARVRSLVLTLALVLLAGRTLARNPVWASTDTVMARLIQEHPEGGRAQWALGVYLETNGAPREANAAYRAALGRMYRSYGIIVDIARRQLNQGHLKAAEVLLEEGLTTPAAPDAAELMAVLQSRGDDPARAERWARLALLYKPQSRVPWFLLSSALGKQGRSAEAALAHEQVLRLGDNDQWQAWLQLARLRRDAGNDVGARMALDTARIVAADATVVRRIDSLFTARAPAGPDD